MKPSDIRIGCTYTGKDGLLRTVTGKAKRNRKWWVSLKEEPFYCIRLHKFAAWATSVVQ